MVNRSERLDALTVEAREFDDGIAQAAVPTTDAPGVAAPETEAGKATPASEVSSEDEARALVTILFELAKPLLPEVEQIYPPEVRERLAMVSAPLMAKYGVTLSGASKWQEEINFALVAVPLAFATVKAWKDQKRETGKNRDTNAKGEGAKTAQRPNFGDDSSGQGGNFQMGASAE